MGKSKTPPAPDYKGAAIAESNLSKYNETGPFGTVNWRLRPGADPNNPQPGDQERITELSPEQKMLYDQMVGTQGNVGAFANSMVSGLMPDDQARTRLTDALYRRSTKYYDQNFGNQEGQLRAQLINSGLNPGSQAYDQALKEFNQRRNEAYAGAADSAALGAEQQTQSNQTNAVNRLLQLLNYSRFNSQPTSANTGQVPDLSGAAARSYQADLNSYNANQASRSNLLGGLVSLGSTYFGLSDKRLKSDIVKVAGGRGGLQAYEYSINGRRERGYLAQEVQLSRPEAVTTLAGGWLGVNYSMLGGRP